MIGQGGSGRGVGLVEVARDAELLDHLAARRATYDGDTVSAMLAAFAAEVDEGLAALLDYPESTDGSGGSDGPADRGLVAVPDVLAGRRRGHGLRATTIAVVLGATLSVSGVAAAVTGDPLSPYKGIVSAVRGGDHQLPSQAANVAKVNHRLVGTRAQLAHGDLAGAQATLAALRLDLASMTDLTPRERSAIEARIASLEAALGRAKARAKQQKSVTKDSHIAVPNNTKTSAPDDTRNSEPKATNTAEPKATRTAEPKATRTAEPQATRTAEPANTGVQGSGGTHTAEPQSTETAGGGTDGGGGAQSDATAIDDASTGGGTGGATQAKGATR